MKVNTTLLLFLLSSNALSFTSTEYIERITKEETVTTISYTGEKKVTTTVKNITDPNGSTTTSTEEVVDEIYSSHFSDLKEQILNNRDRLDILDQLDSDYKFVFSQLQSEALYLEQELESQTLTLSSIESEVHDLNLMRLDIEARILEIQTEMIELATTSQINDLKSELVTEQQNLAAINSQIALAENEYNQYNNDLNSKVSSLKSDILDLRSVTTTRVSALSESLEELAKGFEDVVSSYCDLELKMATLLSSSAQSISGCVVESPTPVNLETYSAINLKFTEALAQLQALEGLYERHVHHHQNYETTPAEVN